MNVVYRAKRLLKKSQLVQTLILKRNHIRDQPIREDLSEHGLETLFDVLGILDEVDVESFAAFGTMLGLVREGRIISHDLDVDIAYLIKSDNMWKTIETALASSGYEKVREFVLNGHVTEQSYASGRFNFDIFGLTPQGNGTCLAYLYTLGESNRRDDLDVSYLEFPLPTERTRLAVGYQAINLPGNYMDYVIAAYGSGWKQPDPFYRHEDYWKPLEGAKGVCTLFKR